VTRTHHLWSGVAALMVSLMVGIAAMAGALKGLDTAIFKTMVMTRSHSANASIAIADFVTHLGDPGWRAGFMIIVLAALIYRRCWRSATVFVVTVGLSITGHSVAKGVFARSRPTLVPPLDSVDTYAYPSGHAAGAMVILLLGAMLLGGRKIVIAAVLLALAIGLSRIALGVHWPSDVLGGWLFGGGAALIGYAVAKRVARPKESLS
jgi:membrane-associated phospholipid phosphatase